VRLPNAAAGLPRPRQGGIRTG